MVSPQPDVLLGQVLHDMNRRCPLVIMLALVLGGCQGGSPTIDASQPEAGGDAARSDGPSGDGPRPDGPAADAPAADIGVGKLDTSPKADLVPSSDAGDQLCLSCIKLRVGRPLIARGPYGDETDTSFTVIPLGAGSWRGFSANSKTFAIDGAEPYAMGGARTQVLAPGNAGSYDECGRWLNYAQRVGSQVHGFIHVESSCNYAQSQTHKSMVYASSSNYGLGWTVHGQIITGLDSPTAGKITGEGDCSIVEGGDGHYYAYCLRASDWKTIVARCPTTNAMPGSWKKYHAGQWTQPGLGGQATSLGFVGHAAGRWTSQGQIINIAVDPWSGGLKLSLAPDKVTFAALPEPLLVLEQADWNRPAPTELMEYVSLISPTDGTSQVDGAFLMSHMYIQPGDGFSQRYLVFRDVYLSLSPTPASPQVGVALSRWYNASLKDRWSTTAPVPGNFTSYLHEGIFGYLLTQAHPSLPTNKLEDCVGTWPGHPDHLLTNDGTCVNAGYTRLRTAGWVFKTSQPGTVPLYRCYSQAQQHHFASNAASCDGLGTMEWLLGYALAN